MLVPVSLWEEAEESMRRKLCSRTLPTTVRILHCLACFLMLSMTASGTSKREHASHGVYSRLQTITPAVDFSGVEFPWQLYQHQLLLERPHAGSNIWDDLNNFVSVQSLLCGCSKYHLLVLPRQDTLVSSCFNLSNHLEADLVPIVERATNARLTSISLAHV